MKVGILTFHMSFNYGAMLQAYALSKKLNLLGFEAEIIDYRLPFIDRYHHKKFPGELLKEDGVVLGVLKSLNRFRKGYYSDKKWNRFYKFMTMDLPLSKHYDKEHLKDSRYDIYVCGSDQIWNGDLTGGLQRTYFLDFVNSGAKKAAYAASSGTGCIRGITEDEIYLLKRFDTVGVREQNLSKYLREELHIDNEVVLDPSLLLDRSEWNRIAIEPKYSKYLLIYAFQEDKLVYELARKIAKKRHLRIISLSYRHKNIGDDILQITTAGPREFVGFFKNADFVCTTSFHGTAFSLMYNKQFYCVPHKLYHERTDSLLRTVGMEQRNVYELNNADKAEVDYTRVNNRLSEERNKSIQFIDKWR